MTGGLLYATMVTLFFCIVYNVMQGCGMSLLAGCWVMSLIAVHEHHHLGDGNGALIARDARLLQESPQFVVAQMSIMTTNVVQNAVETVHSERLMIGLFYCLDNVLAEAGGDLIVETVV